MMMGSLMLRWFSPVIKFLRCCDSLGISAYLSFGKTHVLKLVHNLESIPLNIRNQHLDFPVWPRNVPRKVTSHVIGIHMASCETCQV